MDQSTGLSTPHNIIRGTYPQLIAFLVLHVWTSHLGLPLLLAIIVFSKKIQRHSTFINLCLAFIVMGLSASMLLWFGKATGPEPSKLLCLLQASMLYGTPALTSTAALMLVFQMFMVIRAAYHGKEMLDRDHPLQLWTMLILPWFFFLTSVITTAIVGSNKPQSVTRNRRFFYCSVEEDYLSNTLMAFTALILFLTFIVEVWTVVILYKRFRGNGSMRSTMDLNLPVRIL